MSGHLFPVLFLNREAKEVEGVWLLHPVACGPAASVNVGGFTRRYNNTEGERQKKNVACTAPPARFLSWFQSSDVFKLSGQGKASHSGTELSSSHSLPTLIHTLSLPSSLPLHLLYLPLSSASLPKFTAHVSPALAVQRLWRLKSYSEQKVSTGSPSLSPLWSHTGINRHKNAGFTSAELSPTRSPVQNTYYFVI